jgi:hypothetical protein
LVTAHALELLHSPKAYFAAAARALGQAGRGGLSSFAFAPYVARTAREHHAGTLLAESPGRVRAQADVVSRLAGIPIAAASTESTVSLGVPEARSL